MNVLQKFTILSVVVTVVIVGGLGLLVSGLLRTWLLASEVRVTSEALRMVTATDLPPAVFRAAVREHSNDVFEYVWKHLRGMHEVIRMKVYDTDGRIVWSDEEQLIGEIYEDNEELKEALTGEVVAEMGKAKAEHEYETSLAPEAQLMEVYVPLKDENDGSVYGVFELYKHPRGFVRSRRHMLAIVGTAGLGGGVLLFLSLFGLFRASLREQIRLQEVERQYAEIEFELKVAADIQKSLLPSQVPAVPGCSLAAMHRPARLIGGDFYDFVVAADGTLLLAVADGEGKGIPGSLLMVETHSLLQSQSEGTDPVSDIARSVNRFLAHRGSRGLVTMFLARLDPVKRVLYYCSAGHCPGLLLRGGEVRRLEAGGIPLGITAEVDYEEATVSLQSGDVVFIHTDGVTEAVGQGGSLFGGERLQAALKRAADGKAAGQVLGVVMEVLADFTDGAELQDDTTAVCLVVQ